MYNLVWEWKLFNHLKDFYADNAVSHYICNKDLIGINQMQGMLVSLFASFPNAKFLIDRVTCNEGIVKDEWEVAVRWRLQGLHEGIGYFGKPSGNTVEILGITHIKVRNEKIVEEWITFDGLDVLTQIHSPKKSEVAATNIEERV
nr:ester cyclase [Priestia flexa]